MKKKSEPLTIKPLDRQFFLDLAQRIYDPKSRQFLRLCRGLLTNGPDPTNSERKMHCGLGELYFAMTGQHTPRSMGESEVVELTMKNLVTMVEKKRQLQGLFQHIQTFAPELKTEILMGISDNVGYSEKKVLTGNFIVPPPMSKKEEGIELILDDIPDQNDEDECDDKECTIQIYRERSKRVAASFRGVAASFRGVAALLPKPIEPKVKQDVKSKPAKRKSKGLRVRSSSKATAKSRARR